MKQLVRKPEPGHLHIRAYCTKCGKLLLESNPLTKKQLLSIWDNAVIQATQIPCKDCGHKFPNFQIEFKIYSDMHKTEKSPRAYIKARHQFNNLTDMLKSTARTYMREQGVTMEDLEKMSADYKDELNNPEPPAQEVNEATPEE